MYKITPKLLEIGKTKNNKKEQLMGGSVQLQRQLQLLSEFIYTVDIYMAKSK